METTSLLHDVWNDDTTSPQPDAYLTNIHDLVFKVVYIIIGAVGVLDNLFVFVVFIFFIKITDKV